MSVLRAQYFDGKCSRRHQVNVLVAKGRMKIVGRDVDLEVDARRVRRSLRVANTPRWLYLPGGGACVTDDNDTVDRITRTKRYERTLHRWESRPAYAVAAVALVALTAWLLLEFGLPAAVEQVAERIPVEAEASLGRQTLEGLEQALMRPSRVPPSRQQALRAKFSALAQAAGETTPYRLEFRASRIIGPNAFALPSGIIVVTDELVRLAARDDEILSVLAHELGHVRHRHSMRRLLEGSATALVVAGITGDVSSAASLASAAPLLLLHTKYSRDNEREADAFAIGMMRKSNLDPRHLIAILERMEAKAERHIGIPTFLSSHPATKEREAIARAGAPPAGPEPAQQEVAARPEEPRRLALLEPAQQQIAELLEKKDYEGLERMPDGAYAAFGNLPQAAGPALDDWVRGQPASYAARVARGRFLLSHAEIDRARADLEASLKMTAKPHASWTALLAAARGLERARAEDWNGALRHYDESLGLYADPEVLCMRARSLAALRRHADAIADLKRSQAAGHASLACNDRAIEASYNVDDPQEAVALLTAVLRTEPRSIPARLQRAWAFEASRQPAPAFEDLLAAAELGDAWAQYQVGMRYTAGNGVKRDEDQAIEWLSRAADQDMYDAQRQLEALQKDARK